MKKIFLILVLLPFINFAQYKNGKIKYTITIDYDKSIWNSQIQFPPDLKETLKKIDYNTVTLEPILTFTSQTSKFYLENNSLNNDQILAAKVNCNCYKPIYTDLNNKTKESLNSAFIHFNIYEDEYLIVDSLKYDWKLTNETKVINNFKCYKATTIEQLNNNKTKLVIAWYCPEIPISTGPKGYGGLPGLIFELQDNNVVYGVKEINFDTNEEIVLPNSEKYKKVNTKEFNQLIAKRSEQAQEFMESVEQKK